MRRLRYLVAMSLDGYIAGPNGEIDWITVDPEIDFGAILNQFDTILMGRYTFQLAGTMGGASTPGMQTIVCSKTLRQADHPKVTILGDGAVESLRALKATQGKDIWLFGGGGLFRSAAAANLVDSVEVSVIPILLGGGAPLLPTTDSPIKLSLIRHKVYKAGIVNLEYAVERAA